MGGSPVLDVLGILVGHLYHFLTDIVPRVSHVQIFHATSALACLRACALVHVPMVVARSFPLCWLYSDLASPDPCACLRACVFVHAPWRRCLSLSFFGGCSLIWWCLFWPVCAFCPMLMPLPGVVVCTLVPSSLV